MVNFWSEIHPLIMGLIGFACGALAFVAYKKSNKVLWFIIMPFLGFIAAVAVNVIYHYCGIPLSGSIWV